ncbi:hypothetical protein SESBI_04161 [Sesbania bispinosa]|nr:hypothetical protein SESBI_04161 [Sesbania bispinosa]
MTMKERMKRPWKNEEEVFIYNWVEFTLNLMTGNELLISYKDISVGVDRVDEVEWGLKDDVDQITRDDNGSESEEELDEEKEKAIEDLMCLMVKLALKA